MNSRFFASVALYVGTAIGAGIFALPYAVHQVGFFIGLIYLLLIGGIVALTSLLYGEVVLRTTGKHQMTEYAHRYTGTTGRLIITASVIFGTYGALTAYALEVGTLLHTLLGPTLGGGVLLYRLVFFAAASAIIFFGLGLVSRIERVMVIILIGVIILIAGLASPSIQLQPLLTAPGMNYFLPYGVILFAFAAATAIPDMKYLLKGQRHRLKSAILVGGLLPLLVYTVFTLVTIGVSGAEVTPNAILGLGEKLGPSVFIIGAILGCLTMSTSFLSLGEILKETYQDDFGLRRITSWFLVVLVPFFAVLLNLTNFIQVIAVVGTVMGGFEGIVFVWMHHQAKIKGNRKPEFAIGIPAPIRLALVLVFFSGLVYQVISVIGLFA